MIVLKCNKYSPADIDDCLHKDDRCCLFCDISNGCNAKMKCEDADCEAREFETMEVK